MTRYYTSAFVADASTHMIKMLYSSAFAADVRTHMIKILHGGAFVAETRVSRWHSEDFTQ